MSSKAPLYRIQFISNGERYDLYIKELTQGSAKITLLSDKVAALSSPIYTPKK